MIRVCAGPRRAEATPLVAAAFQRSTGVDQVVIGGADELDDETDIAVAIDPDAEAGRLLLDWCRKGNRKLIVFGMLPDDLARLAGAMPAAALAASAAIAPHAEPGRPTESPAALRYSSLAARLGGRPWTRPFARHDFTDEWNNHGYGAIRADGSIWAIADWIRLPGATELACIHDGGGAPIASAAGLFPAGGAEVLWFNRPVGPIDSFEWRLVEEFIASFMADTHVCQPVLNEIPFGCDAAVTMRLDCDEDIRSGKALWQSYTGLKAPLSLAIHTALLPDAGHTEFIRRVAGSGGSILSHSATHAADWGGDHARAVAEARDSADALEATRGVRPVNAVSPFHQTPGYAIQALWDCGYKGCIGGTIRQYPETVLARGGKVAGHSSAFAFHTQQCMLHGDCLARDGDPMGGYRRAFDLAYESRSMFGYLDHPFSSRYSYGWESEALRLSAHEALLAHVRAAARIPAFLNEDDALAFLRLKSGIRISRRGEAFRLIPPQETVSGFGFGVTYRGAVHPIPATGLDLVAPR